VLARLLQSLIVLYQRTLSPLLGDCCRFEPSCSRYAALCLRHHSPGRASWLSLLRVLRCNPLFRGGYDPPPLPSHVTLAADDVDWQRVSDWAQRCAGATPVHAPQRAKPVRGQTCSHTKPVEL
jgi:putative membrane protein insertion efficiency factor